MPDPGNPQDWDRYAYVRNNPVNNTDPTGHTSTGNCIDGEQCGTIMTIKANLWVHFRIKLKGVWQKEHEAAVILGVQYMAEKIAERGRDFKDELGGVILTRGSEGATGE